MAAPTQSRLLKLPRELRNAIYAHLGRSCILTPTDAKANPIWGRLIIAMEGRPNVQLLQACKQIYHEYSESWSDQIKINIFPFDKLDLAVSEIALPKTLPLELFNRKIRCCTIQIDIDTLRQALPHERVRDYEIMH